MMVKYIPTSSEIFINIFMFKDWILYFNSYFIVFIFNRYKIIVNILLLVLWYTKVNKFYFIHIMRIRGFFLQHNELFITQCIVFTVCYSSCNFVLLGIQLMQNKTLSIRISWLENLCRYLSNKSFWTKSKHLIETILDISVGHQKKKKNYSVLLGTQKYERLRSFIIWQVL